MDYIQLGASDLRIGRIALGRMGFGSPGQGHNPWALDHTTAAPIFRRGSRLRMHPERRAATTQATASPSR
jgi:aryl-alcohol dehydrogenase-like predicted oxidoreductase